MFTAPLQFTSGGQGRSANAGAAKAIAAITAAVSSLTHMHFTKRASS
jgi:hypothetical protein